MWDFNFDQNKPIIVDNKLEYNLKQIKEFSKNFDNFLGKEKKLVFLLCENSAGAILGYLSLILNKHVPMMIDSNIDEFLLKKLMKSYKPHYIWTPSNKINGYSKIFTFKNYTLLKSKKFVNYKIHSDLCLLAPTSGSTGSQKYVRQSYKNVIKNTKSIIEYLKINKNHRTITNLPLSYTFGMSIINTHFSVGSTIFLTNFSLLQKEFWNIFYQKKINFFYGVPYTFEILNKLKFFKKKCSELLAIAQAGGKLNEELQKKIVDFSMKNKNKFFVMYGQAEATTRISYVPYNLIKKKIGSIGIPVRNGNISIIKEKKTKSDSGEIFYKGPNVCMGYAFNNLDLKKGDIWKGSLFTGDIGKKDKDGFFYIIGRKKRTCKILGNSINLDEIEDILKNKFKNKSFFAISNDKLIKIIISNINKKKEIVNFLSKKIGVNKSLIVVKKINKIPLLTNGKTDYKILNEL